jgi:probable rRNA maturation factor
MQIDGNLFPYKRKITTLFEKAGEILDEDFSHVKVSVGFVSEEEIKRLNGEFRKIDRKTDVLSFPNIEKTANQKLSEVAKKNDADLFDLDDGNLFLGDIVICKKVARAQAKEYGHSTKREICFLALHGLLHLLGYDHIEKQEEALMNSTAEKILSAFGVSR